MIKQSFIAYAKDKINFFKKAKTKLLASTVLGLAFTALVGGAKAQNVYAAEKPMEDTKKEQDSNVEITDIENLEIELEDVIVSTKENITTNSNVTPSNAFQIGDKAFVKENTRIYKDEYSVLSDSKGLKMTYPETEKTITGCVYKIDNKVEFILDSEKVKQLYAEGIEPLAYLVNGNEGFLKREDFLVLEEKKIEEDNSDVSKEVEVLDVTLTTESKENMATPSEAKIATDSNATIATPSEAKIATDSNATMTTPSEAKIATDSNATMATPSETKIATDSNATMATPSEAKIATDSNATMATPSEIDLGDKSKGTEFIGIPINELVSVRPKAKYFSSVGKIEKGKYSKEYNYRLNFNKITGWVLENNGKLKVYHAKDAEEIVSEMQSGAKLRGYEVNHLKYLNVYSVYQKDKVMANIATDSEAIQSIAKPNEDLTVTSDAKIYSKMEYLTESKNGKKPYYGEGTKKQEEGYVLTDGKEYFLEKEYEKVLEYVALGYQLVGYRLANEYSYNKNGKIVAYEGFYNKDSVISMGQVATPSEAQIATDSNATMATSSDATYFQQVNNVTNIPNEPLYTIYAKNESVVDEKSLKLITEKKDYLAMKKYYLNAQKNNRNNCYTNQQLARNLVRTQGQKKFYL